MAPIGEKVVGRFTVDTLGPETTIVTRMRNAPEIIIGIDWGHSSCASLGSFRGLVVEAERRGYAAKVSAWSKVYQHGRPRGRGPWPGGLPAFGLAVSGRGDPARRSFVYVDKGFSRTS